MIFIVNLELSTDFLFLIIYYYLYINTINTLISQSFLLNKFLFFKTLKKADTMPVSVQ